MEDEKPVEETTQDSGESQIDSPRLFVGGLKRMVEKWELEAVFTPYGDVKDVWIAKDPPGNY